MQRKQLHLGCVLSLFAITRSGPDICAEPGAQVMYLQMSPADSRHWSAMRQKSKDKTTDNKTQPLCMLAV